MMESMQFVLNQANILIIDDCYSNVEILTDILKQKGYINIKNTSRIEHVLKYEEETIPDIIVLNSKINNNYTYELCKNIKMNSKYREIPIVFVGESNEEIDRSKVFQSGGADYLITPFVCEEVINCIETQLKFKFMKYKFKNLGNINTDSSEELKEKINKLIGKNKELEEKVIEKEKQLEEITLELKEFNVTLADEINERMKTEEALMENERQFRCAIEEAPVPMILYNEEGKVKKINRIWSDITGYTAKEMPTISKWAETSEVFAGYLNDLNVGKTFNSKTRLYEGEFSIKTKDGSIKIWDFYSAYISELQDGHKLFVILAIDITEKKYIQQLQKDIEEEKKQLYVIKEYNKIKTEFFSNISHEFKTPINVILSALQLIEIKLRRYKFNDEIEEDKCKYINIMKLNCYRILRIANNIIDITKINSGYLDMNKKNVNIVSIVENVALAVANHIKDRGISLVFDTDVEEKIIACDPEKIERILLNLLSNSVKFTSFGGDIMVCLEDCNEKILIKIKDTGRGIPEDKLNSIFELFVQVDKSLTRDHEGSGIGLYLVKSLVELHGGTISVESKVGSGTEFSICLPCKKIEEMDEEIVFYDSVDEDYIEKINMEFSDIYD